MVIHVKLFSLLRNSIPDYDPEKGILVDLPISSTVADLLTQLGIPVYKKPVVTCNERILKLSDTLEADCTIHILQPLGGG